MKLESMEIEQHPLEPFLPGNARLLMLGSFLLFPEPAVKEAA